VTQPSATIVGSLPVKEIVSSDNVTAGSSVKLIAGGFTPSESVLVGVLGSTDTPSQLTADSRGAIATKVSIPTDAAGKVTVYAYGQTSKRGFRQVVTVEASKTLPATGSDSSPLTLFGVALLATGMLFTARRRLTR
jgi:LPXTG-motif cell wall-anchored protein